MKNMKNMEKLSYAKLSVYMNIFLYPVITLLRNLRKKGNDVTRQTIEDVFEKAIGNLGSFRHIILLKFDKENGNVKNCGRCGAMVRRNEPCWNCGELEKNEDKIKKIFETKNPLERANMFFKEK